MPPQPAGVECITLVRLEGTVGRGALSCGCDRSALPTLVADRVQEQEAGRAELRVRSLHDGECCPPTHKLQ